MNVADSQRLSSQLEALGYSWEPVIEHADVIILNTCMVRQSAEDRAIGRLSSLKPLKEKNPDLIFGLMGCMVGNKDQKELRKKLSYVDVFAPPSEPKQILDFLIQRDIEDERRKDAASAFQWANGALNLPFPDKKTAVSAHVPIVYGCSHACAYCIIPYKRGAERSRDPNEIMEHVRSLASQGIKEITLLGQIVDRYAMDHPEYPNLPKLLRMVNEVEGLERIRFLTSHPNWMTDELLETVRDLPKVMNHIEVPAQAGNDEVLKNMRRGYTDRQYRDLIEKIRSIIPGVSIGTDIIVGFPGETQEQFEDTVAQLRDLRVNYVHLARYSPRKGTLSERTMPDTVSEEEKWRRFRIITSLQEGIAADLHQALLSKTVPVLFEEKKKDRWIGRTENMDLVFVRTDENLHGKVLPVKITWAGPWTMVGEIWTTSP